MQGAEVRREGCEGCRGEECGVQGASLRDREAPLCGGGGSVSGQWVGMDRVPVYTHGMECPNKVGEQEIRVCVHPGNSIHHSM